MKKLYDVENFDFEEHLSIVRKLHKEIKYGKITILTGPNGYGKSLLRKILVSVPHKGKEIKCASISMERRTSPNEGFGAFRSLAIDDPTDATSNATCHLVTGLFSSAEDRFFTIDEPEIGMGKEALLGLIETLKEKISELKKKKKFHGILFITHSEFFIENMPHDKFINFQGMTYEEWKNREIIPVSTKTLADWSLKLWRAVENKKK